MSQLTSEITKEPVGFIVYIKQDGHNLPTKDLCRISGLEIIEVMNLVTAASGFNPEPDDAIGFFLFEDNAKRFIDNLMTRLLEV